jgi:hypothetical protein
VIERLIRQQICGHCPDRSPETGDRHDPANPRECEHECEVFRELPALTCAVERLDPLLACYETAIESIIAPRTGYGRASAASSPLYRHRRAVGRVIKQTVLGHA